MSTIERGSGRSPVRACSGLVIDRHPEMARAVAQSLEPAGFALETCDGVADALADVGGQDPPDFLVIDVGHPDVRGPDAVRVIRARTDLPIVVLTSSTDPCAHVELLDAGADHVFAMPVEGPVLAAQLRAVLRRQGMAISAPLSVGGLEIDVLGHVATVRGSRLDLTPREFDLLVELVSRTGAAVANHEALGRVWGVTDPDASHATVTEHVRRIRRKLADAGEHETVIETVRGYGYRVVEVQRTQYAVAD